MIRLMLFLVVSINLIGFEFVFGQNSSENVPVEFRSAKPDTKNNDDNKIKQPNPDVPYGGVVLDLKYAYTDNLAPAPFLTTLSALDSEIAGIDTENTKVDNLFLSLLFPISSRITGNVGYQNSKYSFDIFSTDPDRYPQIRTPESHSVNTYSLGVRFHIGGSNVWSQ